MNQCQLLGKVFRKSGLAYGKKGGAYLTFTLNTWRYLARDRPEVDYHRIVVFGELAEWAEQHLHEGDTAFIAGRLRSSKWEDPQGNKRYKYEVFAELISVSPVQIGRAAAPGGADASTSSPNTAALSESEDIPF
jgi:single-strand DNA-binding protein